MDQSLPEPKISSKQLEQLLVAINEVPEEDQAALTSRLKLLARLGVPDTERVGTGRRAQFDLVSVFQVAIAIEMIQLSLSTEKAARLITYAWPRGLSNIIRTISSAESSRGVGQSGYPAIITLSLERFDGLTKSDDPEAVDAERYRLRRGNIYTPIVGYGALSRATGLKGYFDLKDPMKSKRIAIINASSLAERIGHHLQTNKIMSREQLYQWCASVPYVKFRPGADHTDGQ